MAQPSTADEQDVEAYAEHPVKSDEFSIDPEPTIVLSKPKKKPRKTEVRAP